MALVLVIILKPETFKDIFLKVNELRLVHLYFMHYIISMWCENTVLLCLYCVVDIFIIRWFMSHKINSFTSISKRE